MEKIMHAPGECPDQSCGKDCDGIGIWGPDAFAEEIYGDDEPIWSCEGVQYGSAMDI